jgi:amino acid transporter
MPSTLKRILIGSPISTADADHQRISKRIGLAVFSSDAISSTAYATGEILLVLVGAAGMVHAGVSTTDALLPIGIMVGILLALVANSYRETIHAYPDGGGAYVVARENLGRIPALVAGASLLTDYILTVAVSIAAGVLALYSAFPSLRGLRVWLCLLFLLILTLGNLRGVKESGQIFAAPTYFYIVMVALFMGFAFYQRARHNLFVFDPNTPAAKEKIQEIINAHGPYVGGVSAFIFARAFASGAVALSGVEAISNGIPAFRKPTSRNASITLGWMAGILGVSFLAISFIAYWMKPIPSEAESALSIMGREVFGDGSVLYYGLQFATVTILVMAANTAFADFPRLAAIIGRDGYLPRQFAARGDRLVFSNGVLMLAAAAAVLIIIFGGDVSALIPLYAVGVFTSFTLSQTGMVRHHLKERQPRWQLSMLNSTLGAIATFIVALVVIISKFAIGAWIVVVLIPSLVLLFMGVHRHYRSVGKALRVAPGPEAPALGVSAVVLVGGVNRSALMALRYARSLGFDNLIAISVAIDEEHTEQLTAQWAEFGISVPLEVLDSPYRDLTAVVLAHLDELDRRWHHEYLTVIIPEFVVEHWWHRLLHNQSAFALKVRLLNRRDTVLISVPYRMRARQTDKTATLRPPSGATLDESIHGAVSEGHAPGGVTMVEISSEDARAQEI